MKIKRLRYLIVFSIILFITIGFAVISSNLNIKGTFNFTKNEWKIYFDNVQLDQNSSSLDMPIISNDKLSISFNAKLSKPGDYYSFDVDVINNSTIDAMFNEVTITGIEDYSDYVDYSIKYKDGIELKKNDILPKDTFETLTIYVYYKDITTEQIPENNVDLDIALTLNYRQANKDANKRETNELDNVYTYFVSNTSNKIIHVDRVSNVDTSEYNTFTISSNNNENLRSASIKKPQVLRLLDIDDPSSGPDLPSVGPSNLVMTYRFKDIDTGDLLTDINETLIYFSIFYKSDYTLDQMRAFQKNYDLENDEYTVINPTIFYFPEDNIWHNSSPYYYVSSPDSTDSVYYIISTNDFGEYEFTGGPLLFNTTDLKNSDDKVITMWMRKKKSHPTLSITESNKSFNRYTLKVELPAGEYKYWVEGSSTCSETSNCDVLINGMNET